MKKKILSTTMAEPMVIPTATKKSRDKLVGTGPFKVVKWTKSQSIELEKNNDYWATKAKLDKVVFKFIKENSIRASELIAGSVDAIDGIDPNDINKLKESKVSMFQSKGMNINYMSFICSRAPFNDPK